MTQPVKAPQRAEVRITGTLHEDARYFASAGKEGQQQAVLQMIVLPTMGLPYFVTYLLGTDGAAHHIGGAKAKALTKGSLVRVYAQGLRAQSDHGMAGLCALGVTAIHSTDVPNHQPSGDNEATHAGALTCSQTQQ